MTTYTIQLTSDEDFILGDFDADTPLTAAIEAHRQHLRDDKRDPDAGYTYEQHGPGWGKPSGAAMDRYERTGDFSRNGAQNFDHSLFVMLDKEVVAIVSYKEPPLY